MTPKSPLYVSSFAVLPLQVNRAGLHLWSFKAWQIPSDGWSKNRLMNAFSSSLQHAFSLEKKNSIVVAPISFLFGEKNSEMVTDVSGMNLRKT